MASGNWRVTHQGIAFSSSGVLLDGQHRLHAIIETDMPIKMWVYRDMADDAMPHIDRNAPRTDANALQLAGHRCSNTHVAIARMILEMGGNNKATTTQVIDAVIQHKEAIEFGLQYSQKYRAAAVRTPVVRAWYTESHQRLTEFLFVLTNGIGEGQSDAGAIRLRNLVDDNRTGTGGEASRRAIYWKAERALRAFLDGQSITKIYPAKEELFSIPKVRNEQQPNHCC